jgi:hypothetical protein
MNSLAFQLSNLHITRTAKWIFGRPNSVSKLCGKNVSLMKKSPSKDIRQAGYRIQPRSVNPGRLPFVPICVTHRSALLRTAPNQKKRVESQAAYTREVADYQELTLMIRIPSLAPISNPVRIRQTLPTPVFLWSVSTGDEDAFNVADAAGAGDHGNHARIIWVILLLHAFKPA